MQKIKNKMMKFKTLSTILILEKDISTKSLLITKVSQLEKIKNSNITIKTMTQPY